MFLLVLDLVIRIIIATTASQSPEMVTVEPTLAIPWAMIALTAAQAIGGGWQRMKASNERKEAEAAFDKFTVPPAVNTMLDRVQELSSQREVPGADIYRSKAKSELAQGVESAERAGTPTDVLGAIQDMYGSYLGFEENMAIKGEEMRRTAIEQELGVLGKIGDMQTQQWIYNELYPYMQGMNTAADLGAAGGLNIGSAITSGMNIAGSEWEMNDMQRQFDEWQKRNFPESGGAKTKAPSDSYYQGNYGTGSQTYNA